MGTFQQFTNTGTPWGNMTTGGASTPQDDMIQPPISLDGVGDPGSMGMMDIFSQMMGAQAQASAQLQQSLIQPVQQQPMQQSSTGAGGLLGTQSFQSVQRGGYK